MHDESTDEEGNVFVYAAITLYGAPSQRASTNDWIGNSTIAGPTTPTGPRSIGFGLR
jgi:hypothetical protein